MKHWLYFVILAIFIGFCWADTPANCTFEDVKGKWIFVESQKSGNRSIDCSKSFPGISKLEITLDYPNIASDTIGNIGTWTMIYNQGFEVIINHRKYFAFSDYEAKDNKVTSFCDRVSHGWSHDVLTNNWACYAGKKVTRTQPKIHYGHRPSMVSFLQRTTFKNNHEFINSINSAQKSWIATNYSMFEGRSHAEMHRLRGAIRRRTPRPRLATVTPEIAREVRALPTDFDWRNVNGINFVSPVRNQGSCGSCYAFASMAMLEARLRVATNNTLQLVFSPQDIVSCSQYSQGCEGGFPYLIAGKYAQDYGVVEEKCNLYTGDDAPCTTNPSCVRHYVADYNYLGGYDGGSNEELMKIGLIKHGPMAVALEVYPDFQQYSGGIYHHTGLQDKYNPFEETNHAVLLVGYGVEPTSGEKFWIVKNSWGGDWGEKGFFRIKRGSDECAIESLVLESYPIP